METKVNRLEEVDLLLKDFVSLIMLDYNGIIEELKYITRDVGEYMRKEIDYVKKDQIEEKELNSLVSYVDKTAEEMLVKELQRLVPEAGFITEENTIATEDKEMMWILDPLDGTTNYLFGIPHYSTSIALSVQGEVKLGMVRDNAKKECFYAIEGQGAYKDVRLLNLTTDLKMNNAIFVTGFPYRNTFDSEGYFKVLDYCLRNSRGVRRLGSAALDLCYVASGRISCYYESFLNIWDIAAGQLIVKEAGGKVSDFKGDNSHLNSGQIVAANCGIYDEILKVLKNNIA